MRHPEALRATFDGKALAKVSLRTEDPAEAKITVVRDGASARLSRTA